MANRKDISNFDPPGPPPPSAPQGKNYLLAIAIDRYTEAPQLYNCVKDATDLVQLLTSKYQFELTEVETLYDGEATQSNILRVFRSYVGTITPNDNLIIYYSGHGTYDPVFDEGYWIPVDGHLDNQGSFISNSKITKILRAIKSHHTFLIADACFSGTLAQVKYVGLGRLERNPSRWVLTAGRNEPVVDGTPGDNSPFAGSILEYLKQNSDKNVFVSDLVQYVKASVGNNSEQIPVGNALQGVGDKGGEFVFRHKGAAAYAASPQTLLPKDPWIPGSPDPSAPAAKRPLKAYLYWGLSAVLVLVLGIWGIGRIAGGPQPSSDPADWLVAMGQNGLYGFQDSLTGQMVIEPAYNAAWRFQEGLAPVSKGGVWGFIDPQGKVVIPLQFDNADGFQENRAVIKIDSTYGYINRAGEPVIPAIYDLAGGFEGGRAYVKLGKNTFHIDSIGNCVRDCPQYGLIGFMEDPRDERQYPTVKLNGQVWMAANLNFGFKGSFCYQDLPENCKQYGRLYPWEIAKEACPPGWHLPTSQEWLDLRASFGGTTKAYQSLISGGESGFNALLGGERYSNGNFFSLGEIGKYWTNDVDAGNLRKINYFYFNPTSGKLLYTSSEKNYAYSCRCVQDESEDQ